VREAVRSCICKVVLGRLNVVDLIRFRLVVRGNTKLANRDRTD
jgi:hypothetical protein